jgi:hypothetical protein
MAGAGYRRNVMVLKSDTWFIIEVALILAVLGVLSFWQVPVYEKGAAMVMVVFADALKVLLGYKFGRSMPQQTTDAKPGQSSVVDSKITNVPEPPPTSDPAPPKG